MDPVRVIGAVRRRCWAFIAALVAVSGAAAWVYAGTLAPRYAAEATIAVDAPRVNVIGIEGVTKDVKTDYAAGATEAAVLRSRSIAASAVERIRLDHPRAFAALAAPPPAPISARAGAWLRKQAGLLPGARAAVTPDDPVSLVDRFAAGLTVRPAEYSFLIHIGYSAGDPVLAAAAVNAVIDAYVDSRAEVEAGASRQAVVWLESQVVGLRDRVVDAEARLEQARAGSGNIELSGRNRLKSRYAAMSIELTDVGLRRSMLEARLRSIQQAMRGGGDLESSSAVLQSSLIRTLREREAELQRRIAQLATTLRDRHPRMIEARREAADLAARIDAESRKLVRGQENDLEILRVREAALRRDIAAVERHIGEIGHEQAHVRTLTADAAATRQIYETVLARFKETRAVNPREIAGSPVRVLGRAIPPSAPVAPDARLIVVAAMSVALIVGVVAAILRDLSDRGFRNAKQVEEIAGLPLLGVVPLTSGIDRNRAPYEAIALNRDTAVAEAVNSLRTSLTMATPVPPRTVMFTSALAGEGKTSSSLSLAVLAAAAGRRAIVIDCDFRNPNVHRALGGGNERGLAECLTGLASVEDAVQRVPETGLYYLAAGSRPQHPGDLLGSGHMAGLLAWCRERYDLVVLDTPPLLAVSDALVLFRQVDAAVFVIAWADTPRAAVLAGLRQIHAVGGAPAGAVLSRIDLTQAGFEDVRGAGYGAYPDRYQADAGRAAV